MTDLWAWVTDKLKENWSPGANIWRSCWYQSYEAFIAIFGVIRGKAAHCGSVSDVKENHTGSVLTAGRLEVVSMTESRFMSALVLLKNAHVLEIGKPIPLSVSITSKRLSRSLKKRKTGLLKMKRVGHKTAQQVSEAMIELLAPVRLQVKTITSDNGKEFAQHKKVKQKLFSPFFFADAYASWQRGTNENTNGLIREYLPKGCDFRQVSDDEMQDIENKLNNRPRKRLGFKTPMQAFYNIN